MEWSKAKNILIALLLVVNVFLLGMYIVRTGEVKRDELEIRSEVCQILQRQGIEVEESKIPLDSMEISPATIGILAGKKSCAESLLGKVSESNDGDRVAYSGERGTVMFAKDSFSLLYESRKEITSISSAQALATEIISKMSLKTDGGKIEAKKADGGYVIIVPQSFSEIELFDCNIEIKISENGSVIAHGKYICEGEISTYSDEVFAPSSLMLSFADAVEDYGLETVRIENISIGYVAKTSDRERLSLAPTLKIQTDNGVFYVDMQTEKVRPQ